MNTQQQLHEYFSGLRPLAEMGTPIGLEFNLNPLSHREERMEAVWQDILVRLEVIWLDVMDVAPDAYEEAFTALEQIRRADHGSLQSVVSVFHDLVKFLAALEKDRSEDREVLKDALAHMQELADEVDYYEQEFFPKFPKAPGVGFTTFKQSKRQKYPRAVMKPIRGAKVVQKVKEGYRTGLRVVEVLDAGPLAKGSVLLSTNPSEVGCLVEAHTHSIGTVGTPPGPVRSLVYSILRHTESSPADLEDSILLAGETIVEVLRTHTDVWDAVVEYSAVVPGHCPSMTLYVEWKAGPKLRPSDVYGTTTLTFRDDRLYAEQGRGWAEIPEGSDESIAQSIYETLQVTQDISPQRLWSRTRATEALCRLVEGTSRGCAWTPLQAAQTIAGYRVPVSCLTQVPPQSVGVILGEEYGSYHLVWRTPVVEVEEPGLAGKTSVGDLTTPPPLPSPPPPASTTPPPTMEAQRVGYTSYKSPVIRLKTDGVFIEDTPITPEMDDERVVAKLVQMATQVESFERLVDTIQVDRKTYLRLHRNLVGSSIHEGKHTITPGMAKHLSRMDADSVFHTCSDCELTIPRYPGRYPKTCPNCGCDLCGQKGYPSTTIAAPPPAEGTLSERVAFVEAFQAALDALHAESGLGMVPWSPSHRTLAVEDVRRAAEDVAIHVGFYLPLQETRDRRVGMATYYYRWGAPCSGFVQFVAEAFEAVRKDVLGAVRQLTPLPRTLAEASGTERPGTEDTELGFELRDVDSEQVPEFSEVKTETRSIPRFPLRRKQVQKSSGVKTGRTPLGENLRRIRRDIVASGAPLLDREGVQQYLERPLTEGTNVSSVSTEDAYKLAKQILGDVDKILPNFKTNFRALQAKMSMAQNIPRVLMPVIEPEDMRDFSNRLSAGRIDLFKPYAMDALKKMGLTAPEQNKRTDSEWLTLGPKDGNQTDDVVQGQWTSIPVQDLKPLQNEIWLDKCLANIAKFGPAKQGSPVTDTTIIVSREGYILDGHHRFGQAMLSDPTLRLKALKVPLDIATLLAMGRAYSYAIGRRPKESSSANPNRNLWLTEGSFRSDKERSRFGSALVQELKLQLDLEAGRAVLMEDGSVVSRLAALGKSGEYECIGQGGYGTIHYQEATGKVWFVTGDWFESGEVRAVQEALGSIVGASNVRVEAEYSPKEDGWVQVYPPPRVQERGSSVVVNVNSPAKAKGKEKKAPKPDMGGPTKAFTDRDPKGNGPPQSGTLTPPPQQQGAPQGGGQAGNGNGNDAQQGVASPAGGVNPPGQGPQPQPSGPRIAELRVPGEAAGNTLQFLRAMGMEADKRGGAVHVKIYSTGDLEVVNRVARMFGLTLASF